MTDEHDVNEEPTRPKSRKLPEAIVEMDLPWEPERYDMDACGVERRDGEVDYPFEGCSVWLAPYTPSSLTEAGMQFTASGSDSQGDAFKRLREGLSKVVVFHDMSDPNTGEPLEQMWHNPHAFEDAPSSVVFYLWSLAVSGEPPGERPKGSSRGRRGSSTRSTTGRRSRS